ncbi:MAG: asparagine synthetase B [Spirochaetia bacterium]|nr:asparagine synthetase B [Spirochaetia bacterium]
MNIHFIKKGFFLFFLWQKFLFSVEILVPMDESQKDHLKVYGLVYRAIEKGIKAKILLNYRGGSFVLSDNSFIREFIALNSLTFESFEDEDRKILQKKIETENIDEIEFEKAPKIAIYKPQTTEPWDDAVTMALEYADIPYAQLWDKEVLTGELQKYDWLHLHHEDFTGQYGKFYAFAKNMQWYQSRRLVFEEMAKSMGYKRTADQKRDVALAIQKYVAEGGFLFAMCSATDTLDIALSAQHVDIVDTLIDQTPITPDFQNLLKYEYTFAFENYKVFPDPYLYEFSDIDINPQAEGILQNKKFFTLFDFNAHIDPIPSLLTQNHQREIADFLGQTTAFRLDKIKPRVLILAQSLGTSRVKYIYGGYKNGFFSFYAGHDPEDYQHLVGDPPTNLSLHKNSAGYRLILNNILLPAAKKKKKKT